MAVSINLWGTLLAGVLRIGALLLGVYDRAPDCLETPQYESLYVHRQKGPDL